MIVSSKVPRKFDKYDISEYLSGRFTYFSREEWQKRILDGKISINGAVTLDVAYILSLDDNVSYLLPDLTEPDADLGYTVIYEDEWLVAVNKPGNLLVHKSGKSFKSNLVYQLRFCHKPSLYPEIDAVNRLDRETSGVIILSKDKTCLSKMHEAFAAHAVEKTYIAVVKGIPDRKKWTSTEPIGRDSSSVITYKYTVNGTDARESETEFEIDSVLLNNMSVLKAMPLTGRTHQIRVHLAAAGYPIVGDKLYGMSEDDFLTWRNSGIVKPEEYKYIKRQALHCANVKFVHPFTRKYIVIEAELPDDMYNFISTNTDVKKV
jgi:RluA family pseudouridine synthase